MLFTNTAQEITYRKVSDYLQNSSLFKDTMQIAVDQPRFNLHYGSAQVEIDVLPWEVHPWETGELAIVKACSCVTVGSQLDLALTEYLLQENQRMRFGAFQLTNDGEILFAHSVLGGESMDMMELQTCILCVVTIADTYDDIIAEKFGGQRAADRLP